MEGLIMAAQLLLALTILVGLHEFGHFLFARIFGIRVNKFYIFFDFLFPLPNVMNFTLWKKKSGETEFGLGWFPLGGYVDIAGMVDETKDSTHLATEPQPWEFRSKPAWQRLFVMLGGIIVNIILGVLIFTAVKYTWGDEDYSKNEVNKNGIYAYPLAQKIGFKTGDKIIKINDKDFSTFNEVISSLMNENLTYTVLRGNETKDILIPNDLMNHLAKKESFIFPLMPFSIGRVSNGSAAEKAGLREGDRIVALNGTKINSFQEASSLIKSNANKKIALDVERQGVLVNMNIQVSKDSTIGFMPKFLLSSVKTKYGFGESLIKGATQAWSIIPQQINGFGRIFKGHVSASNAMSGPIGLSQIFGGNWDWERFWGLTGMLSMALAFMNALPIPALDGGHVILILYEIISGKTPSEKFMERTQQVGTFLLLGLMAFVFLNDIVKLF